MPMAEHGGRQIPPVTISCWIWDESRSWIKGESNGFSVIAVMVIAKTGGSYGKAKQTNRKHREA
jgi:hypothetical protein